MNKVEWYDESAKLIGQVQAIAASMIDNEGFGQLDIEIQSDLWGLITDHMNGLKSLNDQMAGAEKPV